LLTVNQLTIALYLSSMTGSFYIIDSHECDASGRFSENGAAVVLRFETLDELLLFLLTESML
jgi:hypothetical protein